jgi:formylglycine-generating enzyme required for sulfatase activity
MKKMAVLWLVVMGFILTAAPCAAEITMDWVTVGNPGNANDDTGYGGVSYEYQIGKYEVTAGQYTEYLNAVAKNDTKGLYDPYMSDPSGWHGCNIQRSGSPGSYSYSVPADWANRPVNFVNWNDVLRFVNWLHNGQPTGTQNDSTTEDGAYDMSLRSSVVRKAGAKVWLPSEDEWYKAAYHKNDGVTGNYFLYPTSSDSTPSNDLVEPTDPGNNATFYIIGDYTIGSPYWRTEVGAHENSDSPYGAFDMGGNVWEWNEALIGSKRGVRGVSYLNVDVYLRSSARLGGWYWYTDYPDLGFRVASVSGLPTPPAADADGPYTIYVGDSLTLDASGSTGADDDIISYTWDLDDDGTFETDAGGQAVFSVDYAYLESLGFIVGGPYDIHLQVTDSRQQSDTDSSTLTIAPPPVIEVDVDIKPGSCPNPLNVKSRGVLPVAILGSAALDVTTIDAGSIFLNGARNVRSGYEDVAEFIADANDCECTTLGPDGYLDLTLKFMIRDIVATLGEVNHDDVLELPLAGFLFDETPVEGADCVVIRGKHKPINKADINKDGLVNTVDIAIVAENWLESSVVED